MSLTKKVAKKATFFITSEAEGAPGFALEPVAHFCSLPIGASPLWRRKLRFLLSPLRRGKILFPHPFRVLAPLYKLK
jgi:hypothetical protein